ncbi:MAG TPA: RNA methyltransferase [Oscillatoriaceae cyanobacterium]
MPIQPLSSLQNPRVKLARSLESRKGRKAAGMFLVEGTKLLGEALTWGQSPVMTFATADWWRAHAALAPFSILTGERYEVSAHVLAAIATTETPDPVVAVLPLPEPAPLALPANALVAIAHRLQDPGNLGTLIRAADAAGATAVLVTDQTVDPYAPKTVRASMGSLFHLPIAREPLAEFRARHPQLPVAALTLGADSSLYAHDYRGGVAFLIGNEGAGLSAEDEAYATWRVKIPMPGHAESLNAAMAATICLYEAVRQRQTLHS